MEVGKMEQAEVKAGLQSQAIKKDSAEEFITEHYWGYTTLKRTERERIM